ncbi:MAG: Do family serine endopeptidase [Armatimonadetes bacterium]|nr:Do family serine endopeptidase [Armatimonadota bacterium]
MADDQGGTSQGETVMQRWNRRDLVAGFVIVFLVGLLAGQHLKSRQLTSSAAAAEPAAAPAADVAGLRRVSSTFADVAAKLTPAVVNINSTRIIKGQEYYDPFREFFYGNGNYREPDTTSESLGSGVILSADGLVVTNNHVVADADEIRVAIADSREFTAKLIGRDPASDVAVLRIDARGLPHAEWGDSDALRVGDWVVAIGNPFGFSETVTAGIVSAKGRRDVGLSDFEEFIQTDAAINPGNSGGALVDLDGRLVGINTAIFSKSGGYQGIGFAIPAKVAQRYSDELVKNGRVIRGWIGVIVRQLNSRIAQKLGVAGTDGVVVTTLWEDQPAVRGEMRVGDVIVEVNGQKVKSPRDLRVAVADAPVGGPVTLKILRGRRSSTVTLKVAEHPNQDNGDPAPGI